MAPPPPSKQSGDTALAQRVVDLESKLEKLEARLNTTSKTAVWLRYQTVELLKKAGMYVNNRE
jgi:hypothetical protein